jgi:hypothetical protein
LVIPPRNPFAALERFGYLDEDNFINYSAGPIKLRVDCDSRLITAQTTPEWIDLFIFFKETVKPV